MGERRPDDPPLHYAFHVFVCGNRRPEGHRRPSCGAAGSEELRGYMKDRVRELGLKGVRINSAGCLNRCELGPCLVIYPEGVWYRCASRQDVDTILEQHVVRGGRASELMLPEPAEQTR